MHLVHLTIAPDVIISCLLDWTDNEDYVSGNTRDRRLEALWENYRGWCEENQISDRAQRKLFSVGVLTPDAPGYVEVSQKRLNATGARYMLFWLAHVAKDYAMSHGTDADMHLSNSMNPIRFFFCGFDTDWLAKFSHFTPSTRLSFSGIAWLAWTQVPSWCCKWAC